jgi:S1-C subfamily serine protease
MNWRERTEKNMSEQQSFSLTDVSRELARLVAQAGSHVVAVHARGSVSGFFWTPELVVTAEAGLSREDEIGITLASGEQIAATLIGRDPSTAVAVLKVKPAQGPKASLPGSDSCAAGELAVAVGRRREGAISSLGMIGLSAGPWRSMYGGEIDRLIHLSAMLDRHGEGSAVLDMDGRLIGMAVRGRRASVLAIPTATIAQSVQQLAAHGRVARGYLGAGLRPIHLGQEVMQRMQRGTDRAAIVVSIDPEGPAKRAGLMLGDIITTWDGDPLTGIRDLLRHLGPSSVGKLVDVALLRAGSDAHVSVTIGERPRTDAG